MSAVSGLSKLLDLLVDKQKQDQARKEEALKAFSEALLETELYVNRLNSGEPKDREKEDQLARLWRHSSLSIGVLNKDWVRRDMDKMRYWIDGAQADVQTIEEKGISLADMRERLDELLDS